MNEKMKKPGKSKKSEKVKHTVTLQVTRKTWEQPTWKILWNIKKGTRYHPPPMVSF